MSQMPFDTQPILIGDGAARYRDEADRIISDFVLIEGLKLDGTRCIDYAEKKYSIQKETLPGLDHVLPLYTRVSDAEAARNSLKQNT